MAHPVFHLLLAGDYYLDVLSILRLLLGLGGVYYYSVFGRTRLDAVIYQYKIRRMTFVFFVIEAVADLILGAFGAVPLALVAREAGRLGVAFTVFYASHNVLKTLSFAAPALALPLLLAGTIQVVGLDIDVLSLASIVLVLLSIRNFRIYSRVLKPSKLHDSARKFFLLSVLASYVFQFVGTTIGRDLYVFVELSETLAVGIGFYVVRAVIKSGRA